MKETWQSNVKYHRGLTMLDNVITWLMKRLILLWDRHNDKLAFSFLQVLDWNENPTAEAKQSGINWCINTMHDDAPTVIPATKEG